MNSIRAQSLIFIWNDEYRNTNSESMPRNSGVIIPEEKLKTRSMCSVCFYHCYHPNERGTLFSKWCLLLKGIRIEDSLNAKNCFTSPLQMVSIQHFHAFYVIRAQS